MAVLALIFALLAATITMPPASSGEINGRAALLVWPATSDGQLLEPSNCQAHMVPYSDQDQELLFPCGSWFQPAAGKYRSWLEKNENSMTPFPAIVLYVGPKFTGSGLRGVLPVWPAGKVALRTPFGTDQSLRLLHIPARGARPAQHRSMDRRARADVVTPLLMPEAMSLQECSIVKAAMPSRSRGPFAFNGTRSRT